MVKTPSAPPVSSSYLSPKRIYSHCHSFGLLKNHPSHVWPHSPSHWFSCHLSCLPHTSFSLMTIRVVPSIPLPLSFSLFLTLPPCFSLSSPPLPSPSLPLPPPKCLPLSQRCAHTPHLDSPTTVLLENSQVKCPHVWLLHISAKHSVSSQVWISYPHICSYSIMHIETLITL